MAHVLNIDTEIARLEDQLDTLRMEGRANAKAYQASIEPRRILQDRLIELRALRHREQAATLAAAIEQAGRDEWRRTVRDTLRASWPTVAATIAVALALGVLLAWRG